MEEIKFKTGQEVLVRDYIEDAWVFALYSHFRQDTTDYPHIVCGRIAFKYCIPYKGNEYLVGTTDSPKEDLPFNSVVITGNNCTTNGYDWNLNYYKGNYKIGNTKITEEQNWRTADYIIPYDKFNLLQPEMSLKYNIVK